MSLFRRPSDSSSEDSDDSAASAQTPSNRKPVFPSSSSRGGGNGNGGASASSEPDVESVSASDLQTELSVGPGASLDEHRDVMLASLLEDHFRTLAAEALNSAHPGKGYTRHSPEVQPLAEQLFRQTGQTLSSNSLLSSSSVDRGLREKRHQYLSGLDNLAAGGLNPAAGLLNPMRDLMIQPSKLPHPANDLQLTLQPHFHSHYLSNFEELALLGKGAFGKVFECRNSLDQTKYAVKKIPLSPKLTKRYYEGSHGEMEELLREVKALAMLDHANVVRYHATWIEQPWQALVSMGHQITPEFARAITTQPGKRQLLLDDRSFDAGKDSDLSFSAGLEKPGSYSGIVFGEDTASNPLDEESKRVGVQGLQWSEGNSSQQRALELSTSDDSTSDIFTDGKAAAHSKEVDHATDRRGEEVFHRWLNPRIGDFGLVAQLAKEGLLDDAAYCKSDGGSHKPVGTAYYRPPKWRGVGDSTSSSSSNASPIDEKVDIFALGVVFTEMLWRCGTAMERVDMLKGLQRGSLPSGLRHKLEAEGLDNPVVEEVLTLINAMVDPNPFERWTGARVKKTVEGLLGRLSSWSH
ncbi:hypothetical protein SLS62_005386 [Diatrype stigma]|uniref:Protein kinase domain-containing protein n=1 Tax=Diatrype stigma TaxID=117547 RepID=A0AAN9USP9_9PEZI